MSVKSDKLYYWDSTKKLYLSVTSNVYDKILGQNIRF